MNCRPFSQNPHMRGKSHRHVVLLTGGMCDDLSLIPAFRLNLICLIGLQVISDIFHHHWTHCVTYFECFVWCLSCFVWYFSSSLNMRCYLFWMFCLLSLMFCLISFFIIEHAVLLILNVLFDVSHVLSDIFHHHWTHCVTYFECFV